MKPVVLFLFLMSLMSTSVESQSSNGICETETECQTSDGDTCDRTNEACPVCLRKRRGRVTCTDAVFQLATMQWHCRSNETPCLQDTTITTPAPTLSVTPKPEVTPKPATTVKPSPSPTPSKVSADPTQKPNDQPLDDIRQSQTKTQTTEDSGGVNAGAIVGFTVGALAVLGIGVAYAYRVVSNRSEEFDEEAAPQALYESKQYTQYTQQPIPAPTTAAVAAPPQQHYQATSNFANTSAPTAEEETYGRSSLYDRFSDSSIDSYATNGANGEPRRVENASNLDAYAGSETSRSSFEF